MLLFCILYCIYLIFYIMIHFRNCLNCIRSIMLTLICLKDLLWAATKIVPSVRLSVLCYSGYGKGGFKFRNSVLSLWDDRWGQENKGQDLWVGLEVGVLLEEKGSSLEESWTIAGVLCLKQLIEMCFQNAFKNL